MFLFTKQKSQQDSKFREAYKIGKKEKKEKQNTEDWLKDSRDLQSH